MRPCKHESKSRQNQIRTGIGLLSVSSFLIDVDRLKTTLLPFQFRYTCHLDKTVFYLIVYPHIFRDLAMKSSFNKFIACLESVSTLLIAHCVTEAFFNFVFYGFNNSLFLESVILSHLYLLFQDKRTCLHKILLQTRQHDTKKYVL